MYSEKELLIRLKYGDISRNATGVKITETIYRSGDIKSLIEYITDLHSIGKIYIIKSEWSGTFSLRYLMYVDEENFATTIPFSSSLWLTEKLREDLLVFEPLAITTGELSLKLIPELSDRNKKP